jgi:hypothetical protein
MASLLVRSTLLLLLGAALTSAQTGFTLLDQWKPAYKMLYANPDYSEFTFNATLGLSNTSYYTGVCHTVYNISFNDQGWDYLHIAPTQAQIQNNLNQSYYLAGYAEGFLTMPNISFALKTIPALNSSELDWIDTHISYMINNGLYYTSLSSTDNVTNYWTRVAALLAQVQGLTDGYNAAIADLLANPSSWVNSLLPPRDELTQIQFRDMFLLNFAFEISDVITALSAKVNPHDVTQGIRLGYKPRHCSALIRVTTDDLYVAHDSWTLYETMLRQYKTYQFDTSVSFSGYAGAIASGDDWYVTSNYLAVQETTNIVWNVSLSQEFVLPQSVSEFMRVMTATYLANSGSTWVQYFQYNNSGTYNNQWMVVNMARFTPGSPLVNGTLWVAEQMPGFVESADVTSVLIEQGYWASYNIPYFPRVYNISGYLQAKEREGSLWSYEHYARAKIFRQRAPQVQTLDDMKMLMRYNDFRHDPFSVIPDCTGATDGVCDPPYSAMLTIASRGDLNPYGEEAQYGVGYKWLRQRDHGATDTKIAMYSELRAGLDGLRMGGHVICGPTTSRPQDDIPPFRWSTSNFSSRRPPGAPDLYNFTWQHYTFPYPPHGYWDGEFNGAALIGILVGITALATIAIGIFIYRRNRPSVIDMYTERLPLRKEGYQAV